MSTKTEIDALLDGIRDFRRRHGWSINRLALEASVPWSVLQGMDADTWSPSLKTIRALLTVIGREDPSSLSEEEGAAA